MKLEICMLGYLGLLTFVEPGVARPVPPGWKPLKMLCCSPKVEKPEMSDREFYGIPLKIPESRYRKFHKNMNEYVDPLHDDDHHYGGLTDPFRPHDPTILPPNAWENTGFAHESLWEGTSHQTKKRAWWAFPNTRWQVMPDGELHQLEGEGAPKRVQANLRDHKFDAVHQGSVVGRFELPLDPSGGPSPLKKGVYDIEKTPVQGFGSIFRASREEAQQIMKEMREKQAAEDAAAAKAAAVAKEAAAAKAAGPVDTAAPHT